MNTYIWMELRNWLTFLFIMIGGFITIRTYLSSQKQRRLENSFRLIELFNTSLNKGDIDEWRNLFHGSSEPAGAIDGHFVQYNGTEISQIPFSALFTEGPPDNGAIERMAEIFNLICYEALEKTIDFKVVYFQLGQLMDTTYKWLNTIEIHNGSFIEDNYPYYYKFYKQNKLLQKPKWPRKTYENIG